MDKLFFHTGQAFKEFDKIIYQTEKWIDGKVCGIADYDEKTVRGRVLQRIVALALNPFVRLCNESIKKRNSIYPEAADSFHLGLVKMDPKSGRVGISAQGWTRSLAEFWYEWALSFLAIVKGCFVTQFEIAAPIAVVFGAPVEALQIGGSDKEFLRFCKEGPIRPLSNAQMLVVQVLNKQINSNGPSAFYVSKPFNFLATNCRLGFFRRFRLLLVHVINPLGLLLLIIRRPLIVLIARDLALLPLVKILGEIRVIDSVIISNSNYADQPLWMRNYEKNGFRVHKINYSQNTRPFTYVNDPFPSNLPNLRYVQVDEQWVWTEGYAKYLKALGQTSVMHVVGPILFYLPKLQSTENPSNEIQIAVFDITPVYSEVADRIGLVNNYYSTERMKKFVTDIIAVTEEIKAERRKSISIVLKHKREFNPNHDQSYIEFCKEMESQNRIKITDSSENMFSLLAGCKIAISVPYTATAYVAIDLGTPSIYYECEGQLLPDFEVHKGIKMVSNKESLKEAIGGLL